jgi:flagellar hook assembly protein FlgD
LPAVSRLSASIVTAAGNIRYFLSRPANLSIQILDASGKVVRQVPQSRVSEGWHPLLLKGAAAGKIQGNGVYFVRLLADDGFRCVKRVILVR